MAGFSVPTAQNFPASSRLFKKSILDNNPVKFKYVARCIPFERLHTR